MHVLNKWILIISFALMGPMAIAHDFGQDDGAVLSLNQSQVLAVQGVTNISNLLFRGPRLTPEKVTALADGGIKYILNLQGGDLETPRWFGLLKRIIRYSEPGELQSVRDIESNAARNDSKIGYVNIPLNSLDPVDADQAAKIDQVLLLVRTLVLNGIPLYIHCEHGKDRTGLIVALYRIRYEGWSTDLAYKEWQDLGHSGFGNDYFTGYLDPFFFSVVPRLLEERNADGGPQNLSEIRGPACDRRLVKI
ncbi:MAG: phosphatase domain-containing putative toxin [Bdellovibrionales bacterium]